MLQYLQMAPRKRGPKAGQFDFMCDRTWRLIASLADTSYCNSGDGFLAKKLDCSTRSVRRYVKKLRDDGRLTRTTFAYQVMGGWKKKRLMKTRFDKNEFGLTRHEVMNWKRPVPTKAVVVVKPKKVTKNPYFEVMAATDIEGFGDPYHEDINFGEHPRPCDTQILPKTKLAALLERAKAITTEGTPTDPEYTKLSCRYIKASIAHHNKLRGTT